MFRLLLALTLLSGAAAAQDALTPDGFPSDYKPEDFIPAVPTPKAGPATFSINQLKRQPLTPSGTLPIALPPATTTSTSPSTAPTREILRPLSAVFPVRTTSTVAASDDSLSERSELSESPTRRSSAQLPQGVDAGAQAGTLPQLAANGPLNPKNGGFPNTVWQQTTTTPATFATLPPLQSPAIKEALRRLLLTETTLPTNTSPTQWLTTRLQALQAQGMFESAQSLLPTTPTAIMENITEPATNRLAQTWAASMLLGGNASTACATARNLLAGNQLTEAQRPNWLATVATCAALEAAQASTSGADSTQQARTNSALGLSLQLLPPQLATTNPTLVDALNALQNGQTYEASASAHPLTGAVLAAYPALLNPESLQTTLATLPDVTLRRLRQTTTLPLPLRAAAAQALVAQTNWLPDGLAFVKLVESDDVLSERSELSTSPTRRSSARLPKGGDAGAKAGSESEGGPQPTATTTPAATLAWAGQASANALLKTSPTVIAPHLATTIATAALLMGDVPTATKWLSDDVLSERSELSTSPTRRSSPRAERDGGAKAGSEGEGGERPQPQQPTLRIALHIAQNQPIEEADWLRWLTLQPLGTAAVAQHAQRTLLVAEALGQNIPLTVWDNFRQRTLGQPTPDNPAWQRLIAAAAKQQNIPQTLALLAQALQNQPAHQLPPTTAAAGVQALQAIGQPQLALRLAMESILLPAETTQPETMNEPTAPEAEPPLSTKALNTNPRAAGEAGEVATPSGVTSLGQRDSTNLRAAGEAGESAASSGIMNLGERQSNNLRAAGGAGNKAEQAAPTPTNRSSGVNLNGVRATQEFNPLRAEGGAGHQLVNQASTINSSQAPTQEREAGMKASNLRAEGEAGELAIPSGATSLGGQESNNLRAAGEAEVSEEQSSSPPVRVNGGIRLNALEPSNVYEIYNKQSTPRTATGAKIQPVTISTPTTPQPNLTNTPTSPTTAPAKNPNKYQTTPNPNSNLHPPPRILTPTTPQKPKIILQNN